jgi:3D (Asp-Asp-Asp) domain-containing protein
VKTRSRRTAPAFRIASFAALVACVSGSAIVTKELVSKSGLEPLARVETAAALSADESFDDAATTIMDETDATILPVSDGADQVIDPLAQPGASVDDRDPNWALDTRWFNGRPIRPARVIWMTVTAYSPDEHSCGDSADGITASLHSVFTNAMKMAAADSRVLPLGSMISVPGYDTGDVVPVLDRGGAIKGNRLDMLYPTHEIAREWGVQKLPVTVWEYADGLPADDFRKIRDSR